MSKATQPDSTDTDTIRYSTNTWNLARSLARDCLDIVAPPVPDEAVTNDGVPAKASDRFQQIHERYLETAADRRVWPFDGIDDMLDLVSSTVEITADNPATDDVGRSVSTRIKDSPRYVFDESFVPDSREQGESAADDIEPSGDAVTPAVEGDGAAEGRGTTTEVDIEQVDDEEDAQGEDTPPDSRDTRASDVETLSVEAINAGSEVEETPSFGSKRTNHSPSPTTERDSTGDTPETTPTLDEVEVSDTAREIAEALYDCFVETDETVFTDIQQRFDAVSFPKRNAVQTETVNCRGDTRDERLADLALWVEWWLGDDEAVAKVNEIGPDPMGT